ncbi:MAG: DUF3488 and transglutaminase-like domain-containing protein [Lautropia sp.]|nr:DUF3488 and transglutaminase-like domain-containing protein [Lautropia sp.]
MTRLRHPNQPDASPVASTSTPTPQAGHVPSILRPSLRALGGRLGGTWERDRRDTLLLMAVALLSVWPHLIHLPFWCSAGFGILMIWRLGLLLSGSPLPGRPVRLIASLAIVAAVFAQYRTLVGQEAGVALLLLFLGLKLMEMRARRDFFITIFLCCFLLLAGYLHSQSILMGAMMLVTVPALIAALLTMQYLAQEVSLMERLRQAMMLLLQAAPLALLLFLLFPRPSGPLWGASQHNGQASTGLSDSMSPGDVSKLAESNEVVMRVEFEDDPPSPADMYWRGPTFGQFDGRTWQALPPASLAQLPRPEIRLAPQSPAFHYTITREPGSHRWLLGMETTTELPSLQHDSSAMMPTLEVVASTPLTERTRYRLRAHPLAQSGHHETARTLAPWLQLPQGYNPRTLGLAAQWRTQLGQDTGRLVEQTLAWIRREPFSYTLKPQALGHHSIDEFLFETRAGFCEHYSSAFVFLMRAMGIPARVVTGYQGADPHENGYWIVRQANAHAWAEVWYPDAGWRRVDPTSAVAPERIEHGNLQSLRARGQTEDSRLMQAASDWKKRWTLNLDAITHQWNVWLLSYGRGNQTRLLEKLGLEEVGWRALIGLLAAGLAIMLAVIALFTLRARLPRDPVERIFDEFCQRMAMIGAERMPHETANQFLYRVERLLDADSAALAYDIVATYNHLRYDLGSHASDLLADFNALVRAFKP